VSRSSAFASVALLQLILPVPGVGDTWAVITHHRFDSSILAHEVTAVSLWLAASLWVVVLLCLGVLQLALVVSAEELLEDVAPADQVIKLLGGEVALADEALETVRLLLSVLLVGTGLLEDLDVVLGVLVLQGGSEGCGLLNAIAVGSLELLDDGVECLDSSASGVKSTANSAVGAGVLVEKLDECLLGAATLVRGGLEGTLLEVLDGGVRGDALLLGESLCVLGFGVDLGDQDVGLVDEVVGESLPDGGKGLAVCRLLAIGLWWGAEQRTSAPGGSEGNQDILVLSDLLLEALVIKEGDGAGELALDLGLDSCLLGDELGQALEITAALVVLGLVALSIEPLQCREPSHAEALAQGLVLVRIDLGDRDLTSRVLENAGELFVDGSEVLAVATPRGEEFDKGRLARLQDNFIEVLGCEVDNGGRGRWSGGKGREQRDNRRKDTVEKHDDDVQQSSMACEVWVRWRVRSCGGELST
jgi:hypothetical protein